MTGIVPADPNDDPRVALGGYIDNRQEYFIDGREGVDRWGRKRAHVTACGSGWGEGQYVCPAYVEESCPGNRGPGIRIAGDRKTKCDLLCGECGGGGRAFTMAYCGFERGAKPFRAAMAEMGGSLRLDRYTAQPASALPPWGVNFVPSVEWGAKEWMPHLREKIGGDYPWIATTVRTASPGLVRNGQPLRERLGGHQGKICVHGLTKDDVLDDAWDSRKRLFGWLRQEGVDLMVTPQFSYYDEEASCMAVYNTNRIFRWYLECQEAGFPHVGLDWPPGNMEWIRQEYLDFALRNDVKLLCPSYQLLGARGGLEGPYLADLKRLHNELPLDVSFLIFGISIVAGFTQAASMLPGRNVAFVSSDPFARAAFFRIVPSGDHAPLKWNPRPDHERKCKCSECRDAKEIGKGRTFAYNVMRTASMADKAADAVARREAKRVSASSAAAR